MDLVKRYQDKLAHRIFFISATAVSDFYLSKIMLKHEEVNLSKPEHEYVLRMTPKVLNLIKKKTDEIILVSFKLETDEDILV